MGQKPNYNFERKERDRRKAEKKAAKAKAKAEKAELAKTAIKPVTSAHSDADIQQLTKHQILPHRPD